MKKPILYSRPGPWLSVESTETKAYGRGTDSFLVVSIIVVFVVIVFVVVRFVQ
jgi:hypothetical protein